MAHAEGNVSTNTSAGVTSQQDALNANYAATRLAGLESLDERLPDNLFTVEAVIFKRVDTQTALLALAEEDPTPVSPSLDVREPLLRSVNEGLSAGIFDLSPDNSGLEKRAWMRSHRPITPAKAPECVADPVAIANQPLAIQDLLGRLRIGLKAEDFGEPNLSQEQGVFSLGEKATGEKVIGKKANAMLLPLEPPPANSTTIRPTPYLRLIEGLTRFDALLKHDEFRQRSPLDLSLVDSVRRLRRSGEYEILGHLSWQQQVPERGRPQPIYVNLNDGQLQGELAITLGRYLHTSARLWFTPDNLVSDTGQYAQMVQSRRMRSATLHYFDHPLFGMIVRIDKVEHPSALTETFLAFKKSLERDDD
tara:strand:- start:485 stop:1576 length:1092 start_codon:yes stop_codon:yes gene_type:complete